ncbi:MAG: tetratricopeptide repeat protein [Puniceicoccaceae bacterium]
MDKSTPRDRSQKRPAPTLQRGRIFFGLILAKRDRHGQIRFRPNWPRLITFVCLSGAGLYILACTALFVILKYNRGYESFTFKESLTAAFNLSYHRTQMGNQNIELAKELLNSRERQDILQSYAYLRAGVRRAPTNLEGRILLAEFNEILYRRADIAADLLIEGLYFADRNPEYHEARYIASLFRVLLRNYMDFRAIEVSRELLQKLDPSSQEFQFVATQLALALFYRGDFTESEAVILRHNLSNNSEGLSLLALIRHNQNRTTEAIELLENHLDQNLGSRVGYERLMAIFRDIRDYDRVRTNSLIWSIRFPDYAAARVNLMFAYDHAGDEEAIKAEVEDLLSHNPNPDSLIQILSFASESGRPELIQTVIEKANLSDGDRVMAQAKISLAEAFVRAGQASESLELISELEKDNPVLFASVSSLINGIRSVALFFDNRPIEGQAYLREFLADPTIRPSVYLAMAKLFESSGHPKVARDVLAESFLRHPQDHRTLSAIVQLDAQVRDLPSFRKHIRALVKSRIPTREAVDSAYLELSSDRHLFLSDRDELFLKMASFYDDRS